MIRELTCIVCPVGCSLKVELDGDKVISVEGNTCPRGVTYANAECTNPMRSIATTVRCKSGELLPVKTKNPIPKEKIFEAMEIINRANPDLPISVGEVIIEDVFGSEIVATANLA